MLRIEISEMEVKQIIADAISDKIGRDVKTTDISVEVKSKQNFKSEWEMAHFRAVYSEVFPFGAP